MVTPLFNVSPTRAVFLTVATTVIVAVSIILIPQFEGVLSNPSSSQYILYVVAFVVQTRVLVDD